MREVDRVVCTSVMKRRSTFPGERERGNIGNSSKRERRIFKEKMRERKNHFERKRDKVSEKKDKQRERGKNSLFDLY